MHDCEEICEQDGICIITGGLAIKKKKVQILQISRESIEFEEKGEQERKRLNCKIKIPKNKFKHEGKHKCELKVHMCGYICKQCNRMCDLEFGHYDEDNRNTNLHRCTHEHINNGNIITEENSVKLCYQDKILEFMNMESANIYTCYEYCKQQGRGHIHIIEQFHLSQIKNLNSYNAFFKPIKQNLYRCKCEFFWKQILRFRFDEEFDNTQKKSFNKCPALCPLCNENSKISYCDLDLWHEPLKDSDNCKDFWISKEGHKFYCQHPIPCHTIFIIDKSGSMNRVDIQPKLPSISQNKNFNNRFGRLIESMNNYIIRRKKISPEDVFSVVSFSDKAEIILPIINCDSNEDFDFVEECMKKIKKCEGETEFYLGFKKGKEILDKIDRNKYKPVIILLSDGADQKPNKTIEIVKEVSIF